MKDFLTRSINRRLQFYFVSFALCLLLAVAVLVSYRVQSDFIDYLNEEKHQSLDKLATNVQRTYGADSKQWQQFISQPRLYKQAVDAAFAQFSGMGANPPYRPPPHHHKPPHHKPSMHKESMHKPPEHRPPQHMPPAHRPPHGGKPPRQPRAKKRPILPVALQDTQGNLLYGKHFGSAKSHFLSPVKDATGNTIAYFTLPKSTSFSSVQQKAYLKSLKRTLWIILIFGVLVSLLVAHLLAKAFTKPISRLNHAVKNLNHQNFGTQLPVERNDELGQLTAAFNDMTDKLASSEAQQRKWLGSISHDLRTPVAVLKGEIDAVIDGVRQPSTVTFESLSQEVDSLSMMLDQFHAVALSEITTQANGGTHTSDYTGTGTKLSPKPVLNMNPTPLLKLFAKRSEQRILDAGLLFQTAWCYDDITVQINELSLTQIWQNLLQNSIRYTDTGSQHHGVIDVATSVTDHSFVITWQDSAPSVPAHVLNKLTEPLFRVEESRNRAFAGSGLGLSIVKDIVTDAGGLLQLSHSELGGLKVTIKLPLS